MVYILQWTHQEKLPCYAYHMISTGTLTKNKTSTLSHQWGTDIDRHSVSRLFLEIHSIADQIV